jgi:DNA-binding NarL/FixJ family response regulator
LVAQGCTNDEIAQRLCLSSHTVKRHVANILAKLHERTRTDAVMRAMQQGVLA